MLNQYRIDIVDSSDSNLKSPPCGAKTIVYLNQGSPRASRVNELANAIKEGKAILCSKWDARKQAYVVYSSFIK